MAFDGNGNFTRLQNWVADKGNTIPITASRVDNDTDDMVVGMELALLRDGQNAATGSIDLGSNKIINLANATLVADATRASQVQNSSLVHVTTTGSANAYVATFAPVPAALAAGQTFFLISNFANTATATLNVNSLGAKTIKLADGSALVGDEIASGQAFIVMYDGTDFILLSMDNLRADNTESFIVAVSDETTDLTTGTAKVTFRMPYGFELLAGTNGVRANVNTAPVGSTIIVDINEAGGTILSTKLTIDASETTSQSAATPPVISDTTLAADAEITIDIDQVGSSTTGKGLKIILRGYKT